MGYWFLVISSLWKKLSMTNVLFSLNLLNRKATTSANGNGDFEPKIIPRFSEIGKFSIGVSRATEMFSP